MVATFRGYFVDIHQAAQGQYVYNIAEIGHEMSPNPPPPGCPGGAGWLLQGLSLKPVLSLEQREGAVHIALNMDRV